MATPDFEATIFIPVTTYDETGVDISIHPTRAISDPRSLSPLLFEQSGNNSLWLIKNEKVGSGHRVSHLELECLTQPGKGDTRTISATEAAAAYVRARFA